MVPTLLFLLPPRDPELYLIYRQSLACWTWMRMVW